MPSLQVCCKWQWHCKCTQIYVEMRKKATLLQRCQNNIHSNYCTNCRSSCKNPRAEDIPLGPCLCTCCPHFTAFSSLRFSPGPGWPHTITLLSQRPISRASLHQVAPQIGLAGSSHGVSLVTIWSSTQSASMCGKHPSAMLGAAGLSAPVTLSFGLLFRRLESTDGWHCH